LEVVNRRDCRWRGERPAVGKSFALGAIESCRGFWWLLGMLDLPSGEGGVMCSDGLLVEKMNSVSLFFFNRNSRFFLTVNNFFLRSNRI
jgi:hypothetical protein